MESKKWKRIKFYWGSAYVKGTTTTVQRIRANSKESREKFLASNPNFICRKRWERWGWVKQG